MNSIFGPLLENCKTLVEALKLSGLVYTKSDKQAANKIRLYFQAHPIVVLTNLPLRSTIHEPDLSRRMTRWAIELSEYGISYKPRLVKKGQVLADFLAEIPQPETRYAGSLVDSQCRRGISTNRGRHWLATTVLG